VPKAKRLITDSKAFIGYFRMAPLIDRFCESPFPIMHSICYLYCSSVQLYYFVTKTKRLITDLKECIGCFRIAPLCGRFMNRHETPSYFPSFVSPDSIVLFCHCIVFSWRAQGETVNNRFEGIHCFFQIAPMTDRFYESARIAMCITHLLYYIICIAPRLSCIILSLQYFF